MVSKTNASNMNKDFALRKEGSTQTPGITNILHAVYGVCNMPKSRTTPNMGITLDGMDAFALTSLPHVPKKELHNPICQKEVHVNPPFRKKYMLSKKKQSPWFNHGAYTSSF